MAAKFKVWSINGDCVAEAASSRTCAIDGQWGLMGINNVPLILMEIINLNGDN